MSQILKDILKPSEFSAEMIAHQVDRKLFDEVTACFQYMRDDKHDMRAVDDSKTRKVIDNSKLYEVIRKHTGLNITLTVDDSMRDNAYVYIPTVDKNHPLLGDLHRQFLGIDDLRKVERWKGTLGTVDLRRGKVTGVFSEIESKIFVSQSLIKNDYMPIDGVAAVFLHEVGHIIGYYAYMGRLVTNLYIAHEANLRLSKANNDEVRYEQLKILRGRHELDTLTDDDIKAVSTNVTAMNLVVTSAAEKPISGMDSAWYDSRAYEQLADQYVSKLGGQRALALGLDIIYRRSGAMEHKGTMTRLILGLIRFVLYIAAAIYVGPIAAVIIAIMAIFSTGEPIYDPLDKRIDKIRQQLIDRSKLRNISKDERKRIDDEIKDIDLLLKDIKVYKPWESYIASTINFILRKNENRAKMVNELEGLVNNNLYAAANRLASR